MRLDDLTRALSASASPIVRRGLAGTVVLAGCVAFAVTARGAQWFPVDDAYITLHNALALLRHRDENFPGVSPLVGATSGAHVLLVALLAAVFEPLRALHAARILGATLYPLALLRVGAATRASAPMSLLLLAFGMLLGRTPHQLMNGLETGLALAGVTFALAEHLAETRADEPERPRVWLPLACGALPFLRPELALLSAMLLGLRLLRRRAEGPRALLRDLALALAAAAPFALAYLASTGSPIPSTVSAKRNFFAEGCLPPATKRLWVLGNLGVVVGLMGYASRALLLLPLSSVGRLGAVFGAVMVAAYYVSFPGALGHYEQRYLYVLLPFVTAALAVGATDRRRWLRWASVALLFVGADESLWRAKERWVEHRRAEDFTRYELDAAARFMNERLPRGARVLVHDVGYVSWATRFALIDIVGLKSPGSAEPHRALTWPSCGARRGEAVARIAREGRATHLVALTSWDGIYRFVDSLRAQGWVVREIRAQGLYRVYALQAPPEVRR